jgi:CBS domain-containing protein
MRIHELVRGQETYRADVNQNVLEIAQAMVSRNIGAVPVLENGVLVGVFSERDLMRRVVVEGRESSRVLVGEVMTRDPLTVSPLEEVETCRALMKRHGFRHLPVCEGAELIGMASLRDILLCDIDAKDEEVRMMRAYIQAAV